MDGESSKIQEINDVRDNDELEDQNESDDDLGEDGPSSEQSSSKKKKKKKKSKAAKLLSALSKNEIPQELVDQVMDQVKAEGSIQSGEVTETAVREALEQMKLADFVKGKAGLGGNNQKDLGKHKFWETQPVPQIGEGPPEEDGFIEPSKPREEVKQDPYPLPKEFEWASMDIDDPVQIKEVYDLLSANYVEDGDASFRFKYSAEFFQWALRPPGYHKDWHVGVRVSSNKKLVAFISGIPMTLRVRKNVFPVAEINFLCVHKRLRSKRLAPVLIKEVTRLVHLRGVFQAIYTAGVVIPQPLAVCRYNHRPLNVPKLIDVKFSHVPRNTTLARMIRVNKVPEAPTLNIREMLDRDVPQVADIYTNYMKRFDMAAIMSVDEVRHNFLSGKGKGNLGDGGPGRRREQVTWSYVVEDPKTREVTDFFSFFSLPSTVIGNPKGHSILEAAYLYYYASDVAFRHDLIELDLVERLRALIGDALVVANNAKFDVFNALSLMDNVPLLQDLKFGHGDGYLNYYLYNWRTAPLAGMTASGTVSAGRGVGVVML